MVLPDHLCTDKKVQIKHKINGPDHGIDYSRKPFMQGQHNGPVPLNCSLSYVASYCIAIAT